MFVTGVNAAYGRRLLQALQTVSESHLNVMGGHPILTAAHLEFSLRTWLS